MTTLSAEIISWVRGVDGWFAYWQLDEALGIVSLKDKNIRRVVVHRLCKRGELWRVRSGRYSIFNRKG